MHTIDKHHYKTRPTQNEYREILFGFGLFTLALMGAAFMIGYTTALGDMRAEAYANAQGADAYAELVRRQEGRE